MGERIPVYDNHIHMSPAGRNIDAILEYEAAGGTGLTLVTLPYSEVPITKHGDFKKSFEITTSFADLIKEKTKLEVNVAVGPYPVLLIPLATHLGLSVAEDLMMKGMEDAAKMVSEGKACAIGEIGRPHFEADLEIMDASNRILSYGMSLAKENDCPVIIHCENSDNTNENLVDMAKKVGLSSELVVKHSSLPLVTPEETHGLMPSIPASKTYVKEALSKGTRFMLETDYIDDPEKPGSIMAITTVPKKINLILTSGIGDEEAIFRICKDIPDSLYHR